MKCNLLLYYFCIALTFIMAETANAQSNCSPPTFEFLDSNQIQITTDTGSIISVAFIDPIHEEAFAPFVVEIMDSTFSIDFVDSLMISYSLVGFSVCSNGDTSALSDTVFFIHPADTIDMPVDSSSNPVDTLEPDSLVSACLSDFEIRLSRADSSSFFSWDIDTVSLFYIAETEIIRADTIHILDTLEENSFEFNADDDTTGYRLRFYRVCSDTFKITDWFFVQTYTPSIKDSCAIPDNYTAEHDGNGEYILSWNPTESQYYQIEVRSAIEDSSIYLFDASTINDAVKLIDLTLDHLYMFRVRSICSEDNISEFGEWYMFETSSLDTMMVDECTAPAILSAGSISEDFAMLRWTAVPAADFYRVRVVEVLEDSLEEPVFEAFTRDTAAVVIGLSAANEYYFEVLTVCNDSTFSPFSERLFFNTSQSIGRADFSGSEQVESVEFIVYPNPAKESTKVRLDASVGGVPTTVRIIDHNHRVIWQESMEKLTSELSIPLHNVPPGVYTVIVENNLTRQVSKLLVE